MLSHSAVSNSLQSHSPPGSSAYGTAQQEYWSGLPFPIPGDLPNSGIKPVSLMSPALTGRFFTTGATWEGHNITQSKRLMVKE